MDRKLVAMPKYNFPAKSFEGNNRLLYKYRHITIYVRLFHYNLWEAQYN